LGAGLCGFNSFLVLQGVESLDVGVEGDSENGLKTGELLEDHGVVDWVRYGGVERDECYKLGQTYSAKGEGGILTFGI
ncbi:PLP-dependent transferase, partial [Bacillus pumilus]|uniref:PLP-dependent transferase n=1 Tax=Bacillus pumilus TaxID=1408 RepID=UPI00164267C7